MENETTKQIIKAMVFGQAFIEAIEKMEELGHFRHRVKKTGNQFIGETDKYLKAVYGGDIQYSVLDLKDECIKQVEDVLDTKVVFKEA
jgi:hypothetical protein